MTLRSRILASGAGWRASDVACQAGPADPSFEEQHTRICMAVVLDGTFTYRSSRGASTLAPGAILLGNAGDCFECRHQHSVGDRCLSFHFDPEFYEAILADIPGTARLTLDRPAVPPQGGYAPLLPKADAALDAPEAVEEFAYELAAFVATANTDAPHGSCGRSCTGRIQDVVHWIEKEVDRPLPLASLARQACMSPYHFLRQFKRVTGITPHQFVLSLRLRRAAQRLRQTDDPILQVALDSGFSDLSEFNRRFRRALGFTPRHYRARNEGTASC